MTAIAALSRPAQGNQPPSFAMLTTAPGPDVAPYHNRQGVASRGLGGLDSSDQDRGRTAAAAAEGSLEVTTVREGAK
jgi:hypothetical protein